MYPWWLPAAGRFLIRADQPERADVAVVLAGGASGNRIMLGARLARDGFVKKVAYIDLLDIKDPKSLSRLESKGPVFTFPFETTESVDVYGGSQIIVSNDNNFAFSSGRVPGKNDDNEFILLEAGDFLK